MDKLHFPINFNIKNIQNSKKHIKGMLKHLKKIFNMRYCYSKYLHGFVFLHILLNIIEQYFIAFLRNTFRNKFFV